MFHEISINSNIPVDPHQYLNTFNAIHVKAYELTNNGLR
jgi:hypothetical protein